MGARVTIGDLARELGLSKSAVSNALNGVKGVSEQTRARVLELAQARDWRPNATARALSRGQSLSIGVCLARDPKLLANEPFYQMVFAGIESVLIDTEYSLVLRMVGDERARECDIYREWKRVAKVDGVVLFDLVENDPRFDLLTDLGLPAVVAGRAPSGVSAPQVHDEVEPEARAVVEHVVGLGHSNILHVTGPAPLVHVHQRRREVLAAALGLGAGVAQCETDYTFEQGRRAILQSMAEQPATAIVCDSDVLALAALSVCRELGWEVPSQVSVLAWDDSLLCELAHPSITALQRRPFDLGRACATHLLGLLNGEDVPLRTIIPSTLVVRDSSGAAGGEEVRA